MAQKPKVQNQPTHDDRAIHFGFNVGLNTMDFKVEQAEQFGVDTVLDAEIYKLQPGFHVSIVSNFRLGEYFDLRFLPGISFGQRDIEFITKNTRERFSPSPQKISSSYIEFPLLLKYKAKRINNYRPYFVTGGNIRIDMAAKKDYDEEKQIFIRLKPFDYFYEIGIGFDSYLQYFKLSTEIKLSLGFNDVLVHDYNSSRPQYVSAIDKLLARLLMLSFYFE